MQQLYKRFGILNLFCPFRPNGSYLLNLYIYEERIVCKLLCELAKAEGLATNMTNIKFNGKAMEAMTKEWCKKIPEEGVFECTYLCQPEKEDRATRIALGVKFLDWDDGNHL